MTKWEYRLAFVGADLNSVKRAEVLTEWGEDGWEFTGYAETRPGGTEYFMKREVSKHEY